MPIRLKGSSRVIWEVLCDSGNKPLSAYGILTKVRQYGVKHPPTVYRTLHRLEELGWVHRIVSLNAFVVCDPPRSGVTGVFICRHCQQVFIVSDELLDGFVQQFARQHHFKTEQEIIELSGTCGACSGTDLQCHCA